jgi:hypothetical protein
MVWSQVDPTFMWANVNDNRLYKYYPLQGTTQTVRTFPVNVNLGDGEGRPDDFDHYIVLRTSTGAILYDAWADSYISANLPSASSIDHMGMSHSGEYVYVRYAPFGTSIGYGNWLFSRDLTPIRNINTGYHGDVAIDENGDDVFVGFTNPGGGLRVRSHRLVDNLQHDVAFGNFVNGHVSGVGNQRPGWVVCSNHVGSVGAVGYDQIISAKVDGSLETQVWCHARTIQTTSQYTYELSTHAVSSRSGTRIAWGGGWERTTTGNSTNHGYVVRIAP